MNVRGVGHNEKESSVLAIMNAAWGWRGLQDSLAQSHTRVGSAAQPQPAGAKASRALGMEEAGSRDANRQHGGELQRTGHHSSPGIEDHLGLNFSKTFLSRAFSITCSLYCFPASSVQEICPFTYTSLWDTAKSYCDPGWTLTPDFSFYPRAW